MEATSSPSIRLKGLEPGSSHTETDQAAGKRKRSLAEASLRNLQPRKQCPQCNAQHGNAKKGECGAPTATGPCNFIFHVKKTPRSSASHPTLVTLPTANRPLKSVQAHFARLVHDADQFAAKWGMSVGVLATGAVHTSQKATEQSDEVAGHLLVHNTLLGQPRLKVVALKHATGGPCSSVVNNFAVLNNVCRGVADVLETQHDASKMIKTEAVPEGAALQLSGGGYATYPGGLGGGRQAGLLGPKDDSAEDGVEDHWAEDEFLPSDDGEVIMGEFGDLESIFTTDPHTGLLAPNYFANAPQAAPQFSPSTSTTNYTPAPSFHAPPASSASYNFADPQFPFHPDTGSFPDSANFPTDSNLSHTSLYPTASLSSSSGPPAKIPLRSRASPSPQLLPGQGASSRIALGSNHYMAYPTGMHRGPTASNFLLQSPQTHVVPTAIATSDDTTCSHAIPRLRHPH